LAKQADGSVMVRMGNTIVTGNRFALLKDAVPGTDFYAAFGGL